MTPCGRSARPRRGGRAGAARGRVWSRPWRAKSTRTQPAGVSARRSVRTIAQPRPAAIRTIANLLPDAAEEISASFSVCPEIGRFTALVGPPGSGKTTTLVKLAITQGLARGRAVRLISADTSRIGGAEHLRAYAAILGVPFQAVESTAALAQALEYGLPVRAGSDRHPGLQRHPAARPGR